MPLASYISALLASAVGRLHIYYAAVIRWENRQSKA
jgi:hypothetical protein